MIIKISHQSKTGAEAFSIVLISNHVNVLQWGGYFQSPMDLYNFPDDSSSPPQYPCVPCSYSFFI
jgi:hypothetical protein